mgnify:CR=1
FPLSENLSAYTVKFANFQGPRVGPLAAAQKQAKGHYYRGEIKRVIRETELAGSLLIK